MMGPLPSLALSPSPVLTASLNGVNGDSDGHPCPHAGACGLVWAVGADVIPVGVLTDQVGFVWVLHRHE